MLRTIPSGTSRVLIPTILLALGLVPSGMTQSTTTGQPASGTSAAQATLKPAPTLPRYLPTRLHRREAAMLEGQWGIDNLTVRAVESGELIRFSYRVLDPEKMKSLHDKKLEPALIFPDGRVKLVIPSLEKVGQLRQTNTPESGKSYWMAFSNPGRTVKRGDHVDVVIGQFHAEGLIVE
jgi:hypothetical protein